MLYRCDNCGARFREPTIMRWTENHGDGMLERWAEYHCPVCGSDEVDEYMGDDDDAEAEDL